MANIALVQAATQVNVSGSAGASASITINGTVVGNTLILLGAFWHSGTAWTITGTTDGGNSWTTKQQDDAGPSNFGRSVVAHAPVTAGGSRTVSVNIGVVPDTMFYVLGCQEFSGINTTNPTVAFDANQTDTSATDANAGPITTLDGSELIIGVVEDSSSASAMGFGSPASWTNAYRQNDSNTFIGMDAGYWLPGSRQTSYTAQWSHSNFTLDLASAWVVAFRADGLTTDATSHGVAHTEITGPSLNSITWSHTCGAGATKLVVGNGNGNGTLPSLTSVTYNGVALTRIALKNDANFTTSEMWRLNNPPIGTFNIVATLPANSDQAAGAISFIGADPAEGPESNDAQIGVSNPSITVASVAGDIVLAQFVSDVGDTGASTENATLIWEDEDVDLDCDYGMQRKVAVGTSTTLGWTSAAPPAGGWSIVGIAIKPLAPTSLPGVKYDYSRHPIKKIADAAGVGTLA